MNGFLIALGAVALLGGLWALATYNGLVKLRQHCREAWSNVDAELKRRHNLIPNLVEAVKGYAAHERGVLDRVARARAEALKPAEPDEQARHEADLAGSVRSLLAVAEGYPELQASDQFLALQRELANTEDRIQAARRFYNGNVRDLNTRVESFPAMFIANWGRFERAAYFELERVEVGAPATVGFEPPI